jgi:hypothetical protein
MLSCIEEKKLESSVGIGTIAGIIKTKAEVRALVKLLFVFN